MRFLHSQVFKETLFQISTVYKSYDFFFFLLFGEIKLQAPVFASTFMYQQHAKMFSSFSKSEKTQNQLFDQGLRDVLTLS